TRKGSRWKSGPARRSSAAVSTAPSPSAVLSDPGYVPKPGRTTRPTTRSLVVPPPSRLAVTVSPTATPRVRNVRTPSAISSSRRGERPLTIEGYTGPFPGSTPTAGMECPSSVTSLKLARDQPFTAHDESRSCATCAVSVPYVGDELSSCTSTSQFHPYNRGVETRWSRLPAKTIAPVTTATARSALTIVDRAGTEVRPRPGSNAIRTPAVIAGDAPVAASAWATRCGSALPPSRRSALVVALRHAGQAASTSTAATTTSAPSTRAVESIQSPGSGSTSRA